MVKQIKILSLFIIGITVGSFGQNSALQDSNYVVFYYENGTVSSEGILENGIPEGEWKAYFENGNLKSVGSRKNGIVEGEWIFYRENGNKEREINYRNGKKNGTEKVFNSEGILTEQYNFNDDYGAEAVVVQPDGSIRRERDFPTSRYR